MLKFPQKKNKWSGKAQSGFYFDFFLKKIADVFIRNVFINASLFFGEKYMIEVLTKKVIDSFIFNSNRFLGFTKLNFTLFFYISLSILLYFLIVVNVLTLFF